MGPRFDQNAQFLDRTADDGAYAASTSRVNYSFRPAYAYEDSLKAGDDGSAYEDKAANQYEEIYPVET